MLRGTTYSVRAESCLKMAAQDEDRMNLAALQQRDPYITAIVDTASQVALYSFSSNGNEWEKTSIEGTLFVYKRSASPINGFMILNRLGLNNLIEPIIKDLEFQLQDPFLLYRNTKAIFGIWFYDKDECARIGQLMNCLVQVAIEHHNAKTQILLRQRRASESDSMVERQLDSVPTDHQQVDIIQMLSKAQYEYVKSKGGIGRKSEPKPMIDNPNAAATKSTQLIRPMPLKLSPSQNFEAEQTGGAMCESARDTTGGSTPTTAISLEALFRNASITKQRSAPGAVEQLGAEVPGAERPPTNRSISLCESSHMAEFPHSASSGGTAPLHPILQQLMSTGTRVETLEQHLPGDLSPRHPPGPGGDMIHGHNRMQGGLPFGRNPEVIAAQETSASAAQTMSFNIIKPSLGAGGSGTISTANRNKSPEVVSSLPSTTPHSSTVPVSSTNQPDKTLAKTLEKVETSSGSMQQPAASAKKVVPVEMRASPLLTPAEFETCSANDKPPLAITLPAPTFSPDVLLSPMAFTTSSRSSPVTQLSSSGQGGKPNVVCSSLVTDTRSNIQPNIAALTKEQLKQALIYLLQNDANFVSSIHEAYLKSLQAGLSSGKL